MNWAYNKLKLDRAILKAKQLQKETEEEIKEIYISFGGKVRDIPQKRGRPSNKPVDNQDTALDSQP